MSSFGIAVDQSFAYGVGYEGGSLLRIPLRGGAGQVLATGQEWSRDIAVDDTRVFWVRGHGDNPGGAVLAMPKSGGTPSELFPNQADAEAIALDDTQVYWANGGGGTSPPSIRRAPKKGGPIETLVEGLSARRIIVRGEELYFLSLGSAATVQRMPKGGGPVTTLAAMGVAVDLDVNATHAYFTRSGMLEPLPLPSCARPPCPTPTSTPSRPHGELWRVPRAGGKPDGLAYDLAEIENLVVGQHAVLVSTAQGIFEVPLAGGVPKMLDRSSAGSRFALSGGVAYSLRRGTSDALVAYGP